MHIDEGTIIKLLNTSGLVTKTDVAMAQKKSSGYPLPDRVQHRGRRPDGD